ncbi:MAG: hypothetical protein HOM14_04490 [Gammaproteobacteria bacterium]|jgi:hypothetical protein|nr:hypothetical protein [Gammaproteobacteria bacterium]MBT3723465.1 hypothetical protein [Gammaproteobacteria bacterium]MBT4077274.1 hypothetical protein [Gammaproteobacteria bacterium]MBT4196224.1 hypothetical protein [Gammaproteobacteria bacterium]MBT4451969.1 hypothetical protein [Gammaproteobacteria bacterium]
MNYSAILVSAGIVLSLAAPTQLFAASDEEKAAAEAYKKRVQLSKDIKKMRAMRKQLPVPPPSGLFGVYAFPEKGQFVTGINYQKHKFSGLLEGSDSISAQQTVLTAPNPFFGDPMQPPTLRVVPLSAEADVAFPFVNYAIGDKVALVGLIPLIKKKTVLETFAGGAPTMSLGTNTVTTDGIGDVKFGVLYKLYNSAGNDHNIVIDAVLSAPTGSIEEEDVQLTPMNTRVKARLAYGMQLGSGTWDALVGLAYWGKDKKWGWGAQYLGTIPLEDENSEGWRYGDKHEATTWLSYAWEPTLNGNVRLRHEQQGTIKGIDPKIYGPGLGANTDNYGGTRTEIALGVNWMYAPAHNLSIEIAKPLSQDRNGVQVDHDQSLMVSWRNAFF